MKSWEGFAYIPAKVVPLQARKERTMEQIVLNIENKDILPSLERVLRSLDGVSVAKVPKKCVPLQIG